MKQNFGFLFSLLIVFVACSRDDQYLYATPIVNEEKQCWDNHNLAVLSGCWQLGQARMESCYIGNDPTPLQCQLSAWSVCFDDKGNSTSSQVSLTMSGVEYDCSPAYTAQFNDSNQLLIENNQEVLCNGGAFDYNALDEFTCTYESKGLASCVYNKKAAADPDNGTITLLQRVLSQQPDNSPKMCQ